MLDWRDKWRQHIDAQLNAEVVEVSQRIDAAITGMAATDLVRSKRFINTHLQPILARWIRVQSETLIRAAERDLLALNQHVLQVHAVETSLESELATRKLLDVAKAVLSTTGALASIPMALSLSTTSVSVGGILGLLGVTTTVVSAPAAIVGAAVVMTTGYVARDQIKKVKSNTQERLRLTLAAQIQENVLFNRKGTALSQILQRAIETSASSLIKELHHAG
ncbi:hypothetical protein D9M69_552100 [compost metagenome]